MEERLQGAGYSQVPFEAGADLVIVNTCTVTAATDAESRKLIRRARRLNASCRVVVTGCYAQIDPASLSAIPGVSLVIGNEEKRDLLVLLAEEGTRVSDIRLTEVAAVPSISVFTERSRAFVQIQNGCDAFCAYCIIPYARGRSRSVPTTEIVEQVRHLVEGGYPEIVLTGIHIGGYGSDLQPPQSLLSLLRQLEAQTDVKRLRLGSIEPTEISSELIEAVAFSEVICPHFHIPLQSGDDDILRAMNRTYTAGFFADLVHDIRWRLPDAAIGLDVIAGFPGETDAQFENTFRLIEALPVTHLHVFPFSRRPGTPAAQMSGQVPPEQIRRRASRLRALGEAKERAFAKGFIGQDVEVVVEGGRDAGERRGLTRNYLTIRFPDDGDPGRTSRVLIRKWTPKGLFGERL